jgi:hypothetical protein
MWPGLAESEKDQFLLSRVSSQPTRTCRYQLISSELTFVPQLLAMSSLTVTLFFLATDSQVSPLRTRYSVPGRGPSGKGVAGRFSWPGNSLKLFTS